ncbi:beta-N-acetylhexosaminidase [Bacteroides sp. 519]|uniref:beta-N-acetylhexosaminidase n=1 Tax=Bacteroides sp. 519 TaxID=2302937 RepID=UPI0013D51DDA|nr:beta-N-acetylhexosaminidase [Bacteroides sp. 519]NDV57241.1 beta-hexosaminidase [Bacteroides sp. 519]
MKKTILINLFVFLYVTSAIAQINLFPTPSKTSGGKGTYTIGKKAVFEAQGEYERKLVETFTAELSKLDLTNPAAAGNVKLTLDPGLQIKPEGYILHVTLNGVTLEASTPAGLFYAKEALLQLARFNKGTLPVCKIEDHPRYSWRGFMLDESRHFFGKEKVKQYLDIMASLRMNVFHWHLTDEPGWRIEIKRYPKLTTIGATGNYHDPNAPASFYTQEEIKEIVAYAADRHIMIIPEFDMPGHATAVCRAYPEVSGGGEGRWEHFTFHPCKETTYEFINNILDELVQLFPAPYIHIGGDEVHYGNQSWFTDPEIQQFIKDKKLTNEVGLEHYFIRRVTDMVFAKGKKIAGWDEIVDAGVSPSKAIVLWWRHDRKYQLLKALEQGFDVVMCPRRPFYSDFVQYGEHKIGRYWGGYNTIEEVYRFPDPVNYLTQGYEEQVKGIQMCMWTERVGDGKRLDYMVFPRLAAVAEVGWTLEKRKECSVFMQKLPLFLQYLDTKNIYYFNPFAPRERLEPAEPAKVEEDVLQNG